MSFFISESIKSKINEETLDKQLEEKVVSFPIYMYANNCYHEIEKINSKDLDVEADLILSKETYRNLSTIPDTSKLALYVFDELYCNFLYSNMSIIKFESIEKYLIRVKILINNSKMEKKND
jgi:hypothetical protein